jgi:hypothetical protein
MAACKRQHRRGCGVFRAQEGGLPTGEMTALYESQALRLVGGVRKACGLVGGVWKACGLGCMYG